MAFSILYKTLIFAILLMMIYYIQLRIIINKDIANDLFNWSFNSTLHAEAEQKILSIIIDKDLNFQSHKSRL